MKSRPLPFDTKASLEAQNLTLARAIRAGQAKVDELRRLRQAAFDLHVKDWGDYPPREWEEHWWHQIDHERGAMLSMAAEIARVRARGEYFEIVPVCRREVDDILWRAVMGVS